MPLRHEHNAMILTSKQHEMKVMICLVLLEMSSCYFAVLPIYEYV